MYETRAKETEVVFTFAVATPEKEDDDSFS